MALTSLIQKILFLLLSIFSLNSWCAQEALAVRPISANIALVAGQENRAGFKDGSFTSALFNTPLGLSVSDDGTRLFVADSGNNRIRIIHLDQNNDVTTLAGQTLPGKLDGPIEKAQFNNPHGVLYLPGDRLVVNDFGNQLLRLVDLKAGTVSTLATEPVQISMNGVRDMAYMRAANSIFFTQPDMNTLKRLDLKTDLVSNVLNNNSQLTHPAALWCQKNKLYIVDKDFPQIYEIDWKDNSATNPVSVATSLANVLSLSWNGDILYALLQNPGVPAERFFLNNEYNNHLVSFKSPGGDIIPQESLFPLADMSYAPSTGFVPDPDDSRKLYVAKPDQQTIVYYRDLFGCDTCGPDYRNSNNVNEPEYPAKKPKNTFRILFLGDSRVAGMANYPLVTDFHARANLNYPGALNISKQIERELNFQASLDDTDLNFEVLKATYSAGSFLFLWPTYELPDIVKHNDIDLVIIFMPPTSSDYLPYKVYFDHPITSEGIPKLPSDMEYLLTPPLERIPKGAPQSFYNFCKAHDLVKIDGNVFNFDEKLFNYPELHDALVEMYGKPLDVLNQKLSAIKTSSGQPVRLLLCSTHEGVGNLLYPDNSQIWMDAAKKYNFPILDINAEFEALHLAFFPLTGDDHNHMNPDGHLFFGKLIAHDLIHDKLIPWK